jgi:hypothetical protein
MATDDKTPADMNDPTFDRIEKVDLQVEMARSYLDYAMSVIVGRALPDVRDGLKPVHRRVLYAMYDAGYRPDKGYYKSSRIVGDVMGNYHPHGDTAIYDTVVRLAQPWSLRYPLVDGNGNFGSPGNDPAAAMRYTSLQTMTVVHKSQMYCHHVFQIFLSMVLQVSQWVWRQISRHITFAKSVKQLSTPSNIQILLLKSFSTTCSPS